ncbi:MAG: GDSL-type esterase/lipase family protein, partial [Acidimicrobiia bacterium]
MTSASVILAMWQQSNDYVVIAALVAGLFGVNLTSLGLISLAESMPNRWALIGITVVGTSVLTALGLLAFHLSLVAVIPSVLLIGVGLVPLSNALPGMLKDSRRWRIATWFLLGSGIGAVMTVSFSRADWPLLWALGALLLAALFAFSLVSEVVPLALALVLGGIITGSVVNRTSNEPANVRDDAAQRLVVFGDSYISGEGADKYLPGTNVVGENECRRASTAYPYLVADELGYRLDFYACSGAETYEVVAGAAGGLSSTEPSQLQQFLDEGQKADQGDQPPPPIAAVLVSIGGNDSWFGTLGQACFGPGSCDVHRNTLLRNAAGIRDRITFVYDQIRAEVGADVPIVAMPYPLIMTETGCDDSPLTRQEHRFLFEFTEVLNEQTRVAAARAGVNWFTPGVTAFEGHRVCESSDLAVNVLDVAPKEGALLDRILPSNWAHGSVHPNELGHELIAERLTPWLETLLDNATNGETSPNPEPQTATRTRFTPPSVLLTSTRSLGIPENLECPFGELDISVQIRPGILGSNYPLESLTPGSSVCYTEHDGTWLVSPLPETEQTISIPAWDRGVALDFDPDLFSTRQIVLSQRSTGRWNIDVYDYCELNPECADSPA